jgi:DNA replication protein DnaC
MNHHNCYPIVKRNLEPEAIAKSAHFDTRLTRWRDNWTGNSGGLLIGKTGTGKTTTVAIAANRIANEHSDVKTWVRWIRADELSRILNSQVGADQISDLKRAPILVIDDLGHERFPELILEVLGSRYDNSRPTVVTSGLTISSIMDRYGDSTIRRIVEVGNGYVVDLWVQRKKNEVDTTNKPDANPSRLIATQTAVPRSPATPAAPPPLETCPEASSVEVPKRRNVGALLEGLF